MAKPILKTALTVELCAQIEKNQTAVQETFQLLETTLLAQRPELMEWSVLECVDHLNLTHDYYWPRLEQALAAPVLSTAISANNDTYKPSFWGRIYMHFAFNPKYSFPTADEITPALTPSVEVLAVYLSKQSALLTLLADVQQVDWRKTAVSIERGVKFNLGDCLRILVYHDRLHLNQAQRALTSLQS